jgi:hypothetical protein
MNNSFEVTLPKETARLRQVEADLVSLLVARGFQEVLFPRLIPRAAWLQVVDCLGGISEELQQEAIHVKTNMGDCVLCHWQCEPYYIAMAKLREALPPKVFDRSGWSYRNEPKTSVFRPIQFQRIEVVWSGSGFLVRNIANELEELLLQFLQERRIAAFSVPRPKEASASTQVAVRDIVCLRAGRELELVGIHQHGNAFLSQFWPEADSGLESACLGISLSRIGLLLSTEMP